MTTDELRIKQLEKAAELGAAIINGLLTDSQLDFRAQNECGKLSMIIGKGNSLRETALKIFREAGYLE